MLVVVDLLGAVAEAEVRLADAFERHRQQVAEFVRVPPLEAARLLSIHDRCRMAGDVRNISVAKLS